MVIESVYRMIRVFGVPPCGGRCELIDNRRPKAELQMANSEFGFKASHNRPFKTGRLCDAFLMAKVGFTSH